MRHGLILSYPKSGRTWIKAFFVVYRCLTGFKQNIIFEHELNNTNRVLNRLMLIRHPCDILVSQYFHLTIRYNQDIGDLSTFIRSDIGAKDISKYWNEWLTEPQEIIKYEDLFKPVWHKILSWFDIGIDEDAIQEANEQCRFDNIKNNLATFGGAPDAGAFFALENGKFTTNPKNNDAHKFRRGKVSGYMDYLSENDIDFVMSGIPIASRWYDG